MGPGRMMMMENVATKFSILVTMVSTALAAGLETAGGRL